MQFINVDDISLRPPPSSLSSEDTESVKSNYEGLTDLLVSEQWINDKSITNLSRVVTDLMRSG